LNLKRGDTSISKFAANIITENITKVVGKSSEADTKKDDEA
jgi:hypothetical protein